MSVLSTNPDARPTGSSAPVESSRRSRWRNLGDIVCCALLIASAAMGYMVLYWAIQSFPARP